MSEAKFPLIRKGTGEYPNGTFFHPSEDDEIFIVLKDGVSIMDNKKIEIDVIYNDKPQGYYKNILSKLENGKVIFQSFDVDDKATFWYECKE